MGLCPWVQTSGKKLDKGQENSHWKYLTVIIKNKIYVAVRTYQPATTIEDPWNDKQQLLHTVIPCECGIVVCNSKIEQIHKPRTQFDGKVCETDFTLPCKRKRKAWDVEAQISSIICWAFQNIRADQWKKGDTVTGKHTLGSLHLKRTGRLLALTPANTFLLLLLWHWLFLDHYIPGSPYSPAITFRCLPHEEALNPILESRVVVVTVFWCWNHQSTFQLWSQRLMELCQTIQHSHKYTETWWLTWVTVKRFPQVILDHFDWPIL